MPIIKKCRHGRGKAGQARQRAWRRCSCQWLGDLYVSGVRRYVPLGDDLNAARVAYAQLVADREADRLAPLPGAPSLPEVADRWVAQAEADGLRPGTIASYRAHVANFRAWFGDVPLRRIRTKDVSDFDDDLREAYSAGYARTIWHSLLAVLRMAEAEGIVERAPIPPRRPVRRSKGPTGTVERMTLPEAEATIAALPDRLRPMGELALLTGLRRGELLGLRGRDIDLSLGRMGIAGQVTRYGEGPVKAATSDRVVALSPRACELLAGLIPDDPSERLFSMSAKVAQEAMSDAMKRASTYQPRRGWHSLRHAHAALLNRAGVSLRDAAQHLGHGANLPQTLRYGWAAEVNRDAVAALDDARGAAPSARRGG